MGIIYFNLFSEIPVHYILFLLFTLTIFSAHADNLQITTSTNHLASIANMLVEDSSKITVVSNTSSCPEHYHLKPSDVDKVKNADLVIYIDGKFENFIENLIHKSQNILKISTISKLRVRNNNLHIWLDLENVNLILHSLYDKLIEIDPNNKILWGKNLDKSKKQLEDLSIYRDKIFYNLKKVVLLSDSLEYLMPKADRLYINPGMGTMHKLSKLKNIDSGTCLIASSSENWDELALKISHKIIIVDSEKWGNNYLEHYRRIIDIIGKECP
jgi:zinc transport system substrate-binding protein